MDVGVGWPEDASPYLLCVDLPAFKSGYYDFPNGLSVVKSQRNPDSRWRKQRQNGRSDVLVQKSRSGEPGLSSRPASLGGPGFEGQLPPGGGGRTSGTPPGDLPPAPCLAAPPRAARRGPRARVGARGPRKPCTPGGSCLAARAPRAELSSRG